MFRLNVFVITEIFILQTYNCSSRTYLVWVFVERRYSLSEELYTIQP